jgi:hypothetical protein
MSPKNPGRAATPAQHALGELTELVTETHEGQLYRYEMQNSPYLAASENVDAAAFGTSSFKGMKVLINRDALPPGTKVIGNSRMVREVSKHAAAHPELARRAQDYIRNQPIEQEALIKGAVPPEAVMPLSDAVTTVRAEMEAPASLASKALSGAANMGHGALRLVGRLVLVVGGFNMAMRNDADLYQHQPSVGAGGIFAMTFALVSAAGLVDDALAAATIHLGSAPVMDYWDRYGAGPTQVLVADAIRAMGLWFAR